MVEPIYDNPRPSTAPINVETSEFITQYQYAERDQEKNIQSRRGVICEQFELLDTCQINEHQFIDRLRKAGVRVTSTAEELIYRTAPNSSLTIYALMKALAVPDNFMESQLPTTPVVAPKSSDRDKKASILEALHSLDNGTIDVFSFTNMLAELELPLNPDLNATLHEMKRTSVLPFRQAVVAIERLFQTAPDSVAQVRSPLSMSARVINVGNEGEADVWRKAKGYDGPPHPAEVTHSLW
ncbi:hypothetical protein J8273_4936 [Carpediemonas membranifera]|uniref:Uncharacterized protein n=1 Tax=Carpediemonas membranifera TaxID=201153 RepID=A0A8J6BXM5_9EUKA|nr:hypothetical protein J8273_4936 [Carpediemonas membranifera]|eukprot:KAG9393636.1 hypothetical protein J8273_4936 [Carpediemonas membranifera]